MLAEAVVLSMKTAPFLHGREGALGAERDLAQVVVVADAAEHEVGVLGGVRRRRRGLAAVLLDPGLGLGGVAVVDGEVVAALLARDAPPSDSPSRPARSTPPSPCRLLLKGILRGGTNSETERGCQVSVAELSGRGDRPCRRELSHAEGNGGPLALLRRRGHADDGGADECRSRNDRE